MNFIIKGFKCVLFTIILIFTNQTINAQNELDSVLDVKDSINKKLRIVTIAEGTFVLSSYTAFYYLWYKDFDKSKFHFFNDSQEWRGIDKLGHSFSAYWLSNLNYQVFQWAGLNHRKSAIIGGVSSFLYMSTIELLDGYSKEWGASGWDLAANASGVTLFLAQELTIQKQVVFFKYSYFPSKYSKYRPGTLGKSFGEKLLKDYNATKFWLSFDLNSMVSQRIPKWLNLAVGYGATGMTGGFENYLSPDCNCKPVPDSERASEYYLSFDVNLSKIKVKSKFLKQVFFALNSIKIPAPAIGYSKKGWMFLVR